MFVYFFVLFYFCAVKFFLSLFRFFFFARGLDGIVSISKESSSRPAPVVHFNKWACGRLRPSALCTWRLLAIWHLRSIEKEKKEKVASWGVFLQVRVAVRS